MFGTIPVATALVAFADEDVRSFALEHRGSRSRTVSSVVKPLGGDYVVPMAGVLWWAGADERSPRLARASRNALESWLLVQTTIQIAKYSVGRARPSREEGNASFAGFAFDDSRHSFASGHAGNAWAILGAYAMEYDDIPAVSWPLWGAAAAVSASRIHDDQHWASDVVFSMGVGWISNRAVRAWNARKNAAKSTHSMMIVPTGDGWLVRLDEAF